MQVVRTIDTRHNLALKLRLTADIHRLRLSSEYRKKLTSLPIHRGQDIPGIVHRVFRYRDGRTVEVRCHARVMVALMKAMRVTPTIEVTADAESAYSGSFRTWEQQAGLYASYVNGSGHKAASPGNGYHQTGRALDILNATTKEHRALLGVRVEGDRFFNGAVFGDPPHYSWGELG